jgi:hypothetical protein
MRLTLGGMLKKYTGTGTSSVANPGCLIPDPYPSIFHSGSEHFFMPDYDPNIFSSRIPNPK